MHEADQAGEFPAGLEEQFEILSGSGPPDNTKDHFHDDIEFTKKALVQAVMKAFLGLGHFVQQVLVVAVQVGGGKTVFFTEGGQGGAGEEGAVNVFDLVMFADDTHF